MNTASATSALVATLATLQTGDKVRLTFAPASSSSPPDTRSVTVTGRDENAIYTTSGRQRCGQIAGGAILVAFYDEPHFQPTMHQQVRRLLSIDLAN